MRVFVAGGSGVLGRRLVPQLVARAHRVTATTTSTAKLGYVEQLGADGLVMDGLDPMSVGEAVAAARPDVIVHQMTGISMAHAGKPDLKHFDRWSLPTIRLRTEGTDHLLAAAEATGVPHFVAQGYANWNGIREGGWVKTEEDPLDLHEKTPAHPAMAALRHVEDAVTSAGGADAFRRVLRDQPAPGLNEPLAAIDFSPRPRSGPRPAPHHTRPASHTPSAGRGNTAHYPLSATATALTDLGTVSVIGTVEASAN
ncbi:NAD-dependent epimerase/dehydratase family protein [Streptomyces mirabilis]|uniref:NAD-dependent epimerase/dehydratase family protein n=1 Tax=Streptomyces mirabilis TaxID=68239 RepID=UPI0022566CE3|nr:NAD(P)-dependent oxidoreductase [Streptomyces mirabilis]MCX4430497.1 NAD(P)-dependent oxidoreductase [Streptomyces mirabilis]